MRRYCIAALLETEHAVLAPRPLQEVSAEAQAGADADAAAEDANPNFSDSDGVAPSSGGDDPYLSPKLLAEHIKWAAGEVAACRGASMEAAGCMAGP